MPSFRSAKLRHAHHYVQVAAHAEQTYRDGRQEAGLAHFDGERGQIDTSWDWVLQQDSSLEIDQLLLTYGDATASIGEIRYRLREERIARLEAQIAAAQRLDRKWEEGQALGNLALTLAYLGDYEQAIA